MRKPSAETQLRTAKRTVSYQNERIRQLEQGLAKALVDLGKCRAECSHWREVAVNLSRDIAAKEKP